MVRFLCSGRGGSDGLAIKSSRYGGLVDISTGKTVAFTGTLISSACQATLKRRPEKFAALLPLSSARIARNL